MRFDIFQKSADAHVRKAREYLQQAHLARIEHQAAAEHHAALAAMYAQRSQWLEQELANSAGSNTWTLNSPAPRQVEGPQRRATPGVSWLRSYSNGAKVPESA
jgi:hypothetical protein